jgi:NAD(P) transhydrogenase subunit alpha
MNNNGEIMIIGVPKETLPGERRVAIIPDVVPALIKLGLKVTIESDAGVSAGFDNAAYTNKGAEIVSSRNELINAADIIAQVRTLGSNQNEGKSDLELFKSGQIVLGFADPLTSLDEMKSLAEKGVSLLSMEMIPRITRAQSMDVLSSMATVAGYKAVMMSADHLPRMFPMMMTAAGTLKPAKVFVVGAGVAGLQAIASAKRLGAVVYAYDVRSAVKEQIESLGGKFVELEAESKDAEDKGGYAKEMGEEFLKKQRAMMIRVMSDVDIVITTAAVPGRKAPMLINREMVESMQPGSIIVDIAAERGGNCELTKPGETVVVNGVTIMGKLNLPSEIPYHSSQMYAKNVLNFLRHLIKDEKLEFNLEDEITVGTMITNGGKVVHPSVLEQIEKSNNPG